MVLLVLACTGSEDVTSGPTCPPAPGEILRLETGAITTYLDAALRASSGFTTLCLGGGTYETSLELLGETRTLPGRLRVIGTGDTTLVPRTDDTGAVDAAVDPWLLFTPSDELELQDLAFELPLSLSARSVRLDNVELRGFEVLADEDDSAALDILATDSVVVDGLQVSELDVEDQVLRLEGTTVQVDGLKLLGTRSARGGQVELSGDVTASDWEVCDTVALRNEPGHPLVSVFGPLTADGLVFDDNDANGPAVSAWSRMELSDIHIESHRSTWTGAITAFSSAALVDVQLLGVTSSEGALSVYPTAPEERVTLTNVAFGVDDDANERCDISLNSNCVANELGLVDEMICDTTGCR
ncbi:MAG: hypothetical protein GY884_36320 [Proteobacteria bacterium]|nr:hypothetical protein [Pseudomonadota bacterium]